mgnify:CR=1 FL=1
MTADTDDDRGTSPPPEAGETVPPPSFLAVALPFWTGDARAVAWGLTAVVTALVIANVGVLYAVNRWNAAFFDALDGRRLDDIVRSILTFGGFVVLGGAVAYALTRFRIGLQVEWRRWLTKTLVGRWLEDRNYYKLEVTTGDHDNPEARLSDDLKLALEPVVDLAIGLFNALLAALTFLGVLAWVGGAVSFGWGEGRIEVPFAFVLAAIVYAITMSVATWAIGRPLVEAVESRSSAEAAFRFELTRVRESAESIALIKGEAEEQRQLVASLGELCTRLWRLADHYARVVLLTSANGVVLPVIPLLVGAPKYVAGDMSLGALMQVAAAFVQVQMAFNWIMDNFIRLAEWRASANRVVALVGGIAELDRVLDGDDGSQITVVEGPTDALRLTGLSVRRDDGVVVIDEADGIIRRGERVIVNGESGTGKSTLIRAVAGLWPWGRGEIAIPADWRVMFLPQVPYLPLGTLRACMSYPEPADALDTEKALAILERLGLAHLGERLDEEDRWDRVLSGGERQRIAFARILVAEPDLVVMDESTSALDEESETRVMTAFLEALPEATLISVAHRPSLDRFHGRTLILRRERGGVRLVRAEATGRRLERGLGRLLTTYGRVRTIEGR